MRKTRCARRFVEVSVEEFGRWYHARKTARAERHENQLAVRRAAREATRPPDRLGYISTPEAATTTGVSEKTVLKRAKPLGAVRAGHRWWIPKAAVSEIITQLRTEAAEAAADAEHWVSLREATKIIGCDDNTVLTYVKLGDIDRSKVPRNRPSLSRSSVERFADKWRQSVGARTQAAGDGACRCLGILSVAGAQMRPHRDATDPARRRRPDA